jgi:hypothetical protein
MPSKNFLEPLKLVLNQARKAAIAGRLATPDEADTGGTFALRLAVVIAALAILYSRTPITFIHPQFLGEDAYWFRFARLYGWGSFQLSPGVVGYLCSAQSIVALLANLFNPAFAAAIYCYTAIFLTLTVVWLATSPRLDIPCKPLLALAVVVVPMGYEVLGTLDYIQWTLPLGVFALLFMHASRSTAVLAGEAALTGITSGTGPFSVYLAPLFLWQTVRASPGKDRRRMIVLTVINGLGLLIQFWMVGYAQFHTDLAAQQAAPLAPLPWTLWVNTPFLKWMTDFGPFSRCFHGLHGAIIGLACTVMAIWLACKKPYRTQKIFILFFAAIIAVSGMHRFHAVLDATAGDQTTRYFYAGSVLIIWFICCLTIWRPLRMPLTVFVVLTELLLLRAIAGTPLVRADLQWPVWGRYVSSGLPVIFPVIFFGVPVDGYVGMPAIRTGPLSRYAPWAGHSIAGLAPFAPSSSCTGTINPAEAVVAPNTSDAYSWVTGLPSAYLWVITGSAWDESAKRPPKLVLLVDSSGQVTEFGFPGFKQPGGSPFRHAGWQSIFFKPDGGMMRAYAVLNNGKSICALPGQQLLPSLHVPINQPSTLKQISEVVPVVPGSLIVQRFIPSHTLHAMSVQMVDGGITPGEYQIFWRVDARTKGHIVMLGSGEIAADSVVDWLPIDMPVSTTSSAVPDEVEVAFWTDAKTVTTRPASLPLFLPSAADHDPPAEIGGAPAPNGSQLHFSVTYN